MDKYKIAKTTLLAIRESIDADMRNGMLATSIMAKLVKWINNYAIQTHEPIDFSAELERAKQINQTLAHIDPIESINRWD